MIKMFVATFVDYDANGNYDGKAHTIGVYKTYDEARNVVVNDIIEYVYYLAVQEIDAICDFDKMNAYASDTERFNGIGCEWNIEEIEVEI